MADDTENHTIKLLQEMRREMQDTRSEMRKRFDAVDERFDDVDTRIDGLTHIVTLLAANMGGHDARLDHLEDTVAKLGPEPERTV